MRYFIFFAILTLAFACKKEEVPTFSDKDGIAFYYTGEETDFILAYSFALNAAPIEKDTVFVDMRITGKIADHDRLVKVRAGSATTAREGIDYSLPEVFIPAGQYAIKYPVVVFKTPEMANETFDLFLELEESDDFILGVVGREPVTGTTNAVKAQVTITDRLSKPVYWDAFSLQYFGEFSVRKFQFMIEVTGLIDFSSASIDAEDQVNMPVRLRNALNRWEAINGTMLDENGLPVTF